MTSESVSRQMSLIRARCKTYNVTQLPGFHVRGTKPNQLFTGPSDAFEYGRLLSLPVTRHVPVSAVFEGLSVRKPILLP